MSVKLLSMFTMPHICSNRFFHLLCIAVFRLLEKTFHFRFSALQGLLMKQRELEIMAPLQTVEVE